MENVITKERTMTSRLACLLLIMSAGGCASMRSTMLNRMPNDTFVKNSKVGTTGVPVTVKVPTHLDVAVVETLFFYDKNQDGIPADSSEYKLEAVDFGKDRNLRVTSEIIRTPKVMTVDFVRPAAGVAEYNLTFDPEEQYITQFETFIFDRTAEDVGNLLASVIPGAGQQAQTNDPSPGFLLQARSSSAAGGDVPNNVGGFTFGTNVNNYLAKNRVVAYQRFDLNACDFEEQVAAFVQLHLNSCHTCQGRQYPLIEAPVVQAPAP